MGMASPYVVWHIALVAKRSANGDALAGAPYPVSWDPLEISVADSQSWRSGCRNSGGHEQNELAAAIGLGSYLTWRQDSRSSELMVFKRSRLTIFL
jgi:hypothetical protein